MCLSRAGRASHTLRFRRSRCKGRAGVSALLASSHSPTRQRYTPLAPSALVASGKAVTAFPPWPATLTLHPRAPATACNSGAKCGCAPGTPFAPGATFVAWAFTFVSLLFTFVWLHMFSRYICVSHLFIGIFAKQIRKKS